MFYSRQTIIILKDDKNRIELKKCEKRRTIKKNCYTLGNQLSHLHTPLIYVCRLVSSSTLKDFVVSWGRCNLYTILYIPDAASCVTYIFILYRLLQQLLLYSFGYLFFERVSGVGRTRSPPPEYRLENLEVRCLRAGFTVLLSELYTGELTLDSVVLRDFRIGGLYYVRASGSILFLDITVIL